MCGDSGRKNTSFFLDIEIYIDNKAELQKQKFKSIISVNITNRKKTPKPNLKENKQKYPQKTIKKPSILIHASATSLLWYSYELHDKPFVTTFWQ